MEQSGEKFSDRFPLRFGDCTGTTDITIWDSVGSELAKYREGQHLLLEGVCTTPRKSETGKFFVVCSPNQRSKIHPVNVLQGLLNSPQLFKFVLLKDAHKHQSFLCRATITSWSVAKLSTPASPSLGNAAASKARVLLPVHSHCKRLVKRIGGVLRCNFCQTNVQDYDKAFALEYLIEDGTAALRVSAYERAHYVSLQVHSWLFSLTL